ncbi:MAG: hypothetical protein WCA77_01205, partial [Thermoplasmata archaeon]
MNSRDLMVDPVTSAIARAGITGITTKQLTAVTNLPSPHIAARLEQLSADTTITRHGRGLWVL